MAVAVRSRDLDAMNFWSSFLPELRLHFHRPSNLLDNTPTLGPPISIEENNLRLTTIVALP
jgi:hypothetical protein